MGAVRTAVGLMSGTSLDGVDVALLSTDGERIVRFGPARTFPYEEADRALFRAAYRDALDIADRDARPGSLTEAEQRVTLRHAEAVERFIAAERLDQAEIDVVGFHGQTVFHDPSRALTVQIGDGAALADRLNIAVVWDFRAADMRGGGQGAPLAPVFHRALAETAGLAAPVVFLNIGGVANVTYVGRDGELIAFDTGPGNSLLDDWIFARTGKPYDRDGEVAARGTPSEELVARLLANPYFAMPPPKSLDRNAFPLEIIGGMATADGAATLLQFSALSIALARAHFPEEPRAWYASGGGRHNRAMMRAVADALGGVSLDPLETLGFDGDATEAQAFAFLAVRSLDGLPLTFPGTTGIPSPSTGGRLSRPDRAP